MVLRLPGGGRVGSGAGLLTPTGKQAHRDQEASSHGAAIPPAPASRPHRTHPDPIPTRPRHRSGVFSASGRSAPQAGPTWARARLWSPNRLPAALCRTTGTSPSYRSREGGQRLCCGGSSRQANNKHSKAGSLAAQGQARPCQHILSHAAYIQH